jgi:hypothetical protein
MPSSVVDVDERILSRSNSVDDVEFVSASANGASEKDRATAGRRDKGKGKEKEKLGPVERIKEEPSAITFNLNDYGPLLVSRWLFEEAGVVTSEAISAE